jgi:hypothetical protein
VRVKLKGFAGKLLDYPVKKGIAKVLKDVAYRSDGAVTQHVVVRWRMDLPPKRNECWFLMTDLKGTVQQHLVQLLQHAGFSPFVQAIPQGHAAATHLLRKVFPRKAGLEHE